MGEKQFLPLKLNKQIKIELIGVFAHFRELRVLKYLLSFPYWGVQSSPIASLTSCNYLLGELDFTKTPSAPIVLMNNIRQRV